MTTLRRFVLAVFLVVVALFAAMFAYNNPQPIDVDVGFVRLEQISLAAAFGAAVAVGWLLGLMSGALAVWRAASEKRRLERALLRAQAELESLRKETPSDAD